MNETGKGSENTITRAFFISDKNRRRIFELILSSEFGGFPRQIICTSLFSNAVKLKKETAKIKMR